MRRRLDTWRSRRLRLRSRHMNTTFQYRPGEPEPPSGRGQAGSTFVVELSTVLAGQLPGAANLPDAVKLPEAVKLKEGHGTGNPEPVWIF